MSHKSHMNGGQESYSGIVPTKQPNKSGRPPAEVVEGRTLSKENMDQQNLCRTQSRESGSSKLDRVRETAKRDRKLRFTALLHHVTVDLLRDSYFQYHAVPGNEHRLRAFRKDVLRLWLRQLRRRSQRSRWTWARFLERLAVQIPFACIEHPYPSVRFDAQHPR